MSTSRNKKSCVESDYQNELFREYPDLLDMDQLIDALSIGRTRAYAMVRAGEIRSIRIGNSIRIPKRFLIEYIEGKCNNNTDGQPA